MISSIGANERLFSSKLIFVRCNMNGSGADAARWFNAAIA